MSLVKKGNPGYARSRKIKLGIFSLVGFLIMAAIYITGYLIFRTGKNYVTILAVLTVLPTAKIFVTYLMIPWSLKADKNTLEELSKQTAPLKPYCELLITAKEKRFAITYLIIGRDDGIIAFTGDSKAKTEDFETGVVNFLNYYDLNANVKLFTDYRQFEKRAKQLAARNSELTNEEAEHIEFVFEKISIMSI